MELLMRSLLLYLLLEELSKGRNWNTYNTWCSCDILTFSNLAKSLEQGCSSYIVLLQEERESADNRFEWVVVLVGDSAEFGEEVHVVETTEFVFVKETNESLKVIL